MTSEFERHIACEECGSSDGNSLYTDGHTFCFVCHTWKSGDNTNHTIKTTYVQRMEQRGFPQRLSRRGISERVCEEYGITVDGDLLCFHYRDSDNRIIGIKTKSKDKQFRYEGETDGRFFGQNLFRNNGGKRMVICEGELDAATCREAFPSWESVSLPHGAANAKKAMQHNYEWLSTWDEVVLFFDNDSAGKAATQEAAGVLPPGKVKIADLKDYKDASEAAQDDNLEAVRQAIWNAQVYKPDGIIDGKTLLSLVIEPQQDCIHEYPFAGLQEKLQGVRSGELVTITSGTGQGKSSLCRELAAHFLSKGERVGYVALEESNRRTALGLMSAACGKQFHIGEHERSTLTDAYQETLAKWNLFLFDGFGSFDPDNVISRIRYLAAGLDCRVVFLDHLSILLSGLDGDERRMIDTTMTKLRSLCEETGISMFLVSHLRRPQGDKGHENGAQISLGQLRGSHSISQISDAVIGLERDQQSGDEHADTTVRVLKNRFTGETGVACQLKYDKEQCKFYESTTFDAERDF